MNREEAEKIESQRMSEVAVSIAKHVNEYIHRECLKKANYGISDPFLLEEMALAYATAMSRFSLYKVLPQLKRPTWEEMESDAIEALKIAFSHCKPHLEKEHLTCQLQ